MGAERAGYWMEMAESRLNKDFGNFGQRERTLLLSYEGFSYRCYQSHGPSSGNSSAVFGVPLLESWWHPFVEMTSEGYRVGK
jgi:hypothetical protein